MSRITPPSEHDYAAIEAAVMETERGRWFLAEHAARHRVADTETILAAIGRLGNAAPPVFPLIERWVSDVGAILATARAAANGSGPESRPPHLRPMQIADGAITAVRHVSGKVSELAAELRRSPDGPTPADALELYCRDLDSAAVLQEKAILQLSELAGVVDAIEEKLATLKADLADRSALQSELVRPVAAENRPADSKPPEPGPLLAPVDAGARSVEAPPIQPDAVAQTALAKEPPRRTLLLVQPTGPKR